MSDLAEPIGLRAEEEGLLGRLLSVRLQVSWQLAAYAALMVAGASMRFWDLGSRALNHDETLHAWTAWKLFQGMGYQHEPFMHGPFQFFGTAFTFLVFGGAGDYTARILPAIFGSALVALPFFLRSRLGTAGALLAAAAIAFSPTLLFFSRFARNDIYIAFFTLGIVISLWRYVDEQKPRYLYLGALLLGLAFATKETIFINAAVLIAFLNIWLAAHFWRQIRDHNKLDALPSVAALVSLLPFAWAVAALWPFTARWRKRIGLNGWHPAADFLIVLGTLSLPQFAAAIQVPLDALLGINDADLARSAGSGVTRENAVGLFTILALIAATAVVGLRWNARVWLLVAAAFYIPYALLYTSFFTNIDGFYSGNWGSLNYWLEQQDVRRGNQPWFYYLMLLPAYEFLPLLFAAPALFYYAVRGDVFRRFLVFWTAATMFGYSMAGEKMPWVSVNTTLPVIVLGTFALGEVITSATTQRAAKTPALQLEPYARPLAAGALGLAAVAVGVFGPASSPWIALRILLVAAASLGILWLLLPLILEQLGAPAPSRRPRRRRRRPLRQPVSLGRIAMTGSSIVVGGLLAFSLFVGGRAAFQLGDDARELFTFAQSSADVPDVVEAIDGAARTSGLDRDLPIVVDGFLEPWLWYLRDYKQVSYVSVGPGYQPPEGAIVLVEKEDDAALQPHLDQYGDPQPFISIWWFPEFDTYKTLPTAEENVLSLSPRFVSDVLTDFGPEFVGGLFRSGTWDTWWQYLRHRDPGVPLSLRREMVAYFPKEYAAEITSVAAPPEQPPAATEPVPPPSLPPEQLLPVGLVLGGLGVAPGDFSEPGALTVDSQGNLYVTEVANHRIQKFDSEGNFLAQVGGKGSVNGLFNEPWGIATDAQGNVYVADTFNHRIQMFDPDLKFVLAWGGPVSSLDDPEPDAFWGPRDVAVDSNGDVWVTDGGTGRVIKYRPDGSFIGAFGGLGDAPGSFVEPTSIEIAPGGDIFVADNGNRRVQKFDASFRFLAEYPVPGWLYVDSVVKPYIALLPDGGLIVSDPTQNKLFRLDADGTPIATLDAEGAPLVLPRGVAFDSRGYVYVGEAGSHQVRQLLLSDLSP